MYSLLTNLLMRMTRAAFVLLALLAFFGVTAAQVAEVEVREETVLKGMSAQDVIKRFGEPDDKKKFSEGRESWLYGRSFVFISKGQVSAWSDAGDFLERQNLAQVQANPQKSGSNTAEWVNDWTPNSKERAEQDAISEMVSE